MMSKMKNTLDGTKNTYDITKENISEIEETKSNINYMKLNRVGKDWEKKSCGTTQSWIIYV